MKTNLPPSTNNDSATTTKEFFNSYYSDGISLPANEINAAVSFFQSKGFDLSAANSISATLLSQSRIENVNVFQILDTMKTLNGVQLSRVVTEILNYNRLNISVLGYRTDTSTQNNYETRNVLT